MATYFGLSVEHLQANVHRKTYNHCVPNCNFYLCTLAWRWSEKDRNMSPL